MKENNLSVFFLSSEVYPFAKTGGLADVAGSLPGALSEAGCRVCVMLPLYKRIFSENFPLEELFEIDVPVGDEIKKGRVYRSFLDLEKKIPVFLIWQKEYFDRENLYGDEHGDFPDNAERFSFFCRAALSIIPRTAYKPWIIHCNDWQTALVPLYLKEFFSDKEYYKNTGILFTIHNLAYQGIFSKEKLKALGLGEEFFTFTRLEFWGKINLMKAGLLYADLVNTVSPTYSKEIQTPEFGFGLDGVLRRRRDSLYGILNGIDYDVWNPATDKDIVRNYSRDNLEGKRENKRYLQQENGFPVEDIPVVGFVSRLAEQKGIDLICKAAEEMVNIPVQLVILGKGDYKYQKMLEEIAARYPGKVALHIAFDLKMAKRIYAGSDMFLMPSRYEPCGLGQMISFRFGTVPVVRKTGGLADTVEEFNPLTQKGDGFLFEEYSPEGMLSALKKAFFFYRDKKLWKSLVQSGMSKDFSWRKSAEEYIKIYKIILDKIK